MQSSGWLRKRGAIGIDGDGGVGVGGGRRGGCPDGSGVRWRRGRSPPGQSVVVLLLVALSTPCDSSTA